MPKYTYLASAFTSLAGERMETGGLARSFLARFGEQCAVEAFYGISGAESPGALQSVSIEYAGSTDKSFVDNLVANYHPRKGKLTADYQIAVEKNPYTLDLGNNTPATALIMPGDFEDILLLPNTRYKLDGLIQWTPSTTTIGLNLVYGAPNLADITVCHEMTRSSSAAYWTCLPTPLAPQSTFNSNSSASQTHSFRISGTILTGTGHPQFLSPRIYAAGSAGNMQIRSGSFIEVRRV